MKKLSTVLGEIQNAKRPKNISKEFQFYGCSICEALEDTSRYSLYIKLAKDYDRVLLEQALNFVKDYPRAKSKPKLFMWKLKELKTFRTQLMSLDSARLNDQTAEALTQKNELSEEQLGTNH